MQRQEEGQVIESMVEGAEEALAGSTIVAKLWYRRCLLHLGDEL